MVGKYRRYISFFLFLGIIIAFPYLFPASYYLQLVTLAGSYAIVALGLNLVVGNAGQISLGQASFFGIGAYVTVKLMLAGLSFWIALPIGALLTGVSGMVLGYIALRFRGHYLAMATLCFGVIMHILFVELKTLTGGAGGISDIPKAVFLGFPIHNAMESPFKSFHLAWITLLLLTTFSQNVIHSRVGRILASIRDDDLATATLGVDVAKYKIKIFALSAVYAGIGGALYAVHINYIGPEVFGIMMSLDFLIMVVIGGLGTVGGAIVGPLLLSALPEVLRDYEKYRLLFYGGMLMVIVCLAPKGVYGYLKELIQIQVFGRLRLK